MLSKMWGNLIRKYSSKRHSLFLDYHTKLSHCHVNVAATTPGADSGTSHNFFCERKSMTDV